MQRNPEFSADLVTVIDGILNGKLHFLCSVVYELDTWSRV